jgi:hypothetical protein
MKIPIDLVVYTNEEIAKWQGVKMAFITTAIETGVVLYEEKRCLRNSIFTNSDEPEHNSNGLHGLH